MTYISLRRELRRSSDPLTYSCLIGKTDLISIPDRLYVGAFLTVDRSDRQLRSLRPTPTESEIRNLSLGPIPTGSLKSRSDRAREGRRDRPIANSGHCGAPLNSILDRNYATSMANSDEVITR